MSPYGQNVVKNLVESLQNKNIVTLSGFVEGVDFEVFKNSNLYKVSTIAVLGYGFDFFNKNYLSKVDLKNVLFISQFEGIQPPQKWTFPKRDKTLASLSNLVVVVEAGEKSGTFYTVRQAVIENKKVFVVPGSIFSSASKGCLNLLNKGLKKQKVLMYLNPNSVLSVFAKKSNFKKEDFNLTKTEEQIINIIASNKMHFDEIKKQIKTDENLAIILSKLELSGLISNKNGYYCKCE